MQQRDSDFFPLYYTMPDTARQFADQDVYVKKDNLGENFDLLQGLLYQNFATMQSNGIELKITRTKTEEEWEKEIHKMRENGLPEENIPKLPYPKIPITIKCDNVEDVLKAYIYYLTFQNGDRIFFAKSGITASNGACITSKNARNLYADTEFQTQLTSAIRTGDSSALLNLLHQYSERNLDVNNEHRRLNLYKKTKDNATNTTTYTPVEQSYSIENFYKNAVNKYNSSEEARKFEIRDQRNPSQTGQSYPEYEYDPVNIGVRYPDIVGRAKVYQDIHDDNLRKNIKQKYLRRKPILLQYYPLFDSYIRDIKLPRPLYFIDCGSYFVTVYQS